MAPSGNDIRENPDPIVIGIFGISGCGKTTLMNALQRVLGTEKFGFFERSSLIGDVVKGGLSAFHKLEADGKTNIRIKAMAKIKNACKESSKAAIVAGSLMFWEDERKLNPEVLWTVGDAFAYSHIVYLSPPCEEISRRRAESPILRLNYSCPIEHLRTWQNRERQLLRRECLHNGILFFNLSRTPAADDTEERYAQSLVLKFQQHTEAANLMQVRASLEESLGSGVGHLQTMVFLEGDKTLFAEDTGRMFWEECGVNPFGNGSDPLTTLFSSRIENTGFLYRQLALMYEEIGKDVEFEGICERVAARTTIRPEFKRLLQQPSRHRNVAIVVMTLGLKRILTKVLERDGFGSTIHVLGNGILSEGPIITPEVKAAVVQHVVSRYGVKVWAFGEGPADIEMLKEADEAVVVVGGVRARSNRMGAKITEIWPDHPRLKQLRLPSDVRPFQSLALPEFRLDKTSIDMITALRPAATNIRFATDIGGDKYW